jgi:shikimate kinase
MMPKPQPPSEYPPGIRNLFLIGYRATGKNTVARLVAEQLGWDWVDADALLEQRSGRTIRALFDAEGEAGFRDREAGLLEELCKQERRVIATGGGVILRPANRDRLRSSGRVVWLTADAGTLWERIQADPATSQRRPALTVGGLAEIEELLRVRTPHYRACADVTVDTAKRTPEAVAQAVLEHVRQWGL